jgi:hypothetical protein
VKATHKSTHRSAETQQAPREISNAWAACRELYPVRVREKVEAMMADGGLTLADIMALQLAEFQRVRMAGEFTDVDRGLASMLRHLRVICERMGNTSVDPNHRHVRVPDGVFNVTGDKWDIDPDDVGPDLVRN